MTSFETAMPPWSWVALTCGLVLWMTAMFVRFKPGLLVAVFGLICRAFEWVVAEFVTGAPRRPASTPRRDELNERDDLLCALRRAPEDGGLTADDWSWLADVAGWKPALDRRASTPAVIYRADNQVVEWSQLDRVRGLDLAADREWHGDVGLGCMGRDSLVKRRHTDVGSPMPWVDWGSSVEVRR